MKAETTARIEQYRSELPRKREKIFAAAMMLAIAIISAASATYAWVTLSASPEVTSIDTTVVANGSLEIAMANDTGAAPGRSAAGDSTGADSNVVRANTTWGNLVNLSDPSYGLANVVLRPAALNGTTNLLSNPLFGVGYGEDGRVTGMVTGEDFAYTYYDPTAGGGEFLVDLKGEHLGVRAISTVKFTNLGGEQQFAELWQAAQSSLSLAGSNYSKITDESREPGKSYITSLQGLIETYAQNVISQKAEDTLEITAYVPNLHKMVQAIYDDVMIKTGEGYVHIANLYDLTKGAQQGSWFTGDNALENLIADYRAGKLPSEFTNAIVGFDQFVKDYKDFQKYLKKGAKTDFSDLQEFEKKNSLAYWAYQADAGSTVYWSQINTQINWLCNINTATLNGYKLSQLKSHAIEILNASERFAVLHDGVVKRLEKRIGTHMRAKITVHVNARDMGIPIEKDLDAYVTTDAVAPYDAKADYDAVKTFYSGNFRGDTAAAQDTHALAVDLWLRTNAGASATVTATTIEGENESGEAYTQTTDPLRAYLTLEGKIRTQDIQEREMVDSPDGKKYEAFTAVYTADGKQQEAIVYKKADGQYYCNTEDGEVNFSEEAEKENYNPTYTPSMKTTTIVIGYDGVNRVWSDTQMAPYVVEGENNTTLGGGSCYTFYASTPADQSRFLDLLGSMRVAFIDGNGALIGSATMDTEHFYAENGKVTVPLALDKISAINLGDDGSGNTVYGLMPLVKNAATRVTAIVYLDGQKLTNQMVLASGDIQGNLNVQFGSYTAQKVTTVTVSNETDDDGNHIINTTVKYIHDGNDNEAIENEPVMTERIKVSASISGAKEFEYNPQQTVQVPLAVKVEGVEPKSVYARFIRAISATQGVQQDNVELTRNGSDWNGTVTFDKPGNYVLRTIWVDGVEYDLSHEPIEVTIKGSAVNSLICAAIPGGNFARIMQSDSKFSTGMTLGFTTSNQTPSRVNGIFMDENGRQVNVPFYLERGQWKGTATFYSSGTYTMQYVEIDGELSEIRENLHLTLELLLGLKTGTRISASIETQAKLQAMAPAGMTASPTRFVLDPSAKDANGEPVVGKNGVTLTISTKIYDNTGEEIKGLSGVKVNYSRVGSATGGLDAELKWNAAVGAYTGQFLITQAGTYRFKNVQVTQAGAVSTITAATTDTNIIQVMPPDDARYMTGDNHTDTYQYAPRRNAKMTVAIAYSSAASGVKATMIDRTGQQYEVNGTMGLEDIPEHMTGDITSITLWDFAVPTDTDGLQEGIWTLKSITLYGVYYDGKYYDEVAGIEVDVSGDNITTKVVNNIVVTLSGNSQNFTGYFMDDHRVNDMTVTVADYEGEMIKGVTVDGVTVSYTRGSVSMETYGYTTNTLSPIVSGTGNLRNGSATEYTIAAMNFQVAGPYKNAEVELTIDGVSSKASQLDGVVLRYVVDGQPSDNCPQFDVKWTAPTVKITGLNPSPSTTYEVNAGGMSSNPKAQSTHTYISPDGFYAHMSAKMGLVIAGKCTGVTWPKMTLTLSNVGTRFSTAVFSVTNGNGSASGSEAPRDYTFKPGELTQTEQIGKGATGITDGSRQQAGNQKMTTIVMNYNGVAYTMKLSNMVEIYEVEQPIGTLVFQMPVAAQQIGTEELVYPNNQITLPEATDFVEKVSGDTSTAGSRQKVSSTSETVYFRKGFMNYQKVTITSTIYKTPYTGEVFNVTYHVKGWIISGVRASDEAVVTVNNGNMIRPGAKVNLSFGVQYTAIPVLEDVGRTSAGTATTYFYQQVAKDSKQSTSVLEPDGTNLVNQEKMNQYVKDAVARNTYDIGWKDS